MLRQAIALEGGLDIRRVPARERIELDLAGRSFGKGQRAALAAMITLASGDPGIEAAQGTLERAHLAKRAAAIGIARPEIAIRIFGGDLGRVGFDRAQIGQAEALAQDVAIGEGGVEMLAGLEKDHRYRWID